MILWTVQHASVLDEIDKHGVYHTDESHLWVKPEDDDDINHSHYAYLWLCKQMRKRIGDPPNGVTYPIWAMLKQSGKPDGKPDMRSWGNSAKEPLVRLKLDVPDYDVLVTDFGMWHCVLNYTHLPMSEVEFEKFWPQTLTMLGVDERDVRDWSKKSRELTQARKWLEASWDNCIGVNRVNEDWCGAWKDRSFQATFWGLKAEYILSTERFN